MVSMRELGAAALQFVILVFIVGIGATMLTQLQTTTGGNSSTNPAYNVTANGLTGITTFANFLPLIAIVVVLATVVGILLLYLGGVINF